MDVITKFVALKFFPSKITCTNSRGSLMVFRCFCTYETLLLMNVKCFDTLAKMTVISGALKRSKMKTRNNHWLAFCISYIYKVKYLITLNWKQLNNKHISMAYQFEIETSKFTGGGGGWNWIFWNLIFFSNYFSIGSCHNFSKILKLIVTYSEFKFISYLFQTKINFIKIYSTL